MYAVFPIGPAGMSQRAMGPHVKVCMSAPSTLRLYGERRLSPE